MLQLPSRLSQSYHVNSRRMRRTHDFAVPPHEAHTRHNEISFATSKALREDPLRYFMPLLHGKTVQLTRPASTISESVGCWIRLASRTRHRGYPGHPDFSCAHFGLPRPDAQLAVTIIQASCPAWIQGIRSYPERGVLSQGPGKLGHGCSDGAGDRADGSGQPAAGCEAAEGAAYDTAYVGADTGAGEEHCGGRYLSRRRSRVGGRRIWRLT